MITLYTFRRCPYAIRARLALSYAAIDLSKVEVSLKDKPQKLLEISPKGTVPVLVLSDGRVIEQSLDIMLWALAQQDPEGWIKSETLTEMLALIEKNDSEFKYWLDRYKYADRYPEHTMVYYRDQCERWFAELESRLLATQVYLFSPAISLADVALFPFIRQCAHVDKEWFYNTRYTHLQQWLTGFLASELFADVMKKA